MIIVSSSIKTFLFSLQQGLLTTSTQHGLHPQNFRLVSLGGPFHRTVCHLPWQQTAKTRPDLPSSVLSTFRFRTLDEVLTLAAASDIFNRFWFLPQTDQTIRMTFNPQILSTKQPERPLRSLDKRVVIVWAENFKSLLRATGV